MELDTNDEMKYISVRFTNLDSQDNQKLKKIFNGIKCGETNFKIYYKRERAVSQLNTLVCKLVSILKGKGMEVYMPIPQNVSFGKSVPVISKDRCNQHEVCCEQTIVEINYALQIKNYEF
ncbi:MAG: hypothetical protein K2J12_00115 [Muribaculaceae bacterium]|nr:hypothetical protein [Muribaculaceae bacterium]